jgi:CubicO group peptidase (beta-lactamase class C family)
MFRYIFSILFFATTCFAQDISRMDQAVQSFVSDQKFMGSALVARGDKVIFSKGYGSANLEWDIPNTPATKFRLGSITKQFTAAAILLLEERGRLEIQNRVKMYLPDLPAAWDKITIFHLLTHTAGIPNYTEFAEYAKRKPFPNTPEELVSLFRNKPLLFAPGEKMQYSNSNYILLGCLIEKVSGETYQNFIQKNIFDRLVMKDSGYDSNSAIIPHRAAGYSPSASGLINADFQHMSVPFSAGALYSTVEDLWRWEQGLFGGKLLSAASLAKMTTPFLSGYAFGVGVNTVNGRKQIVHGGGISGFNSFLSYFPDEKLTVAVLGNSNGSASQDIAGVLTSLAHDEKIVLPSEIKAAVVSTKILEQYVGTYQLAPKFNMMITVEDGQLMAQASGQGKLPLSASSETQFFSKQASAQIEFVKDDKGMVANLILRQRGNETKAPRISDKVAVRKEIKVSPDVLARYVGAYELQPGYDVTITLEGGQLFTQITGQGKLPMFAESETKFFLKVVDAENEFIKDDKGVVTSVIIRQGPTEMRARRK